jgi:signal transduction histidine kinase/ActR/RegA family two-component response regulator
VRGDKHWLDDDIALFRTAGEIFVNALERERAESEREALAARLRQAQRLEAIGTLAGGIAHNFNNILGAIFGYSEMALARLPRDGRPRRHVEEVRKAAERAKAIVDQILAFGRRVGHRREAVPMRPLIEEAMDLLRASLPATVTLQAHWRTEDAAVLGDPAQLQQVVMNLCTNAAQAMDGSGTVELVLDAVDIEDQHALTHGNLAAGRYARLSVTDTGHGMDAATMERIFEPFFTTKAPTTGTGLGLASVHGIVADHGGALNVRSQPGAGSTFEVYLAATEMAAAVERGEAPSPGGRGETVLLVDDDRPLMLLGEEMLAALGYEPVGHTSARAALAAFRADPHRFDVVLVDEVMPEMSGSQLAAEVHRIRPQLPIILVTGYGITEDRDALRDAGVRELLRKPLASADLAAALARHLPAGRQTAA